MEQKSSYYEKQSINKFDLYNKDVNNAQDTLKSHFLDKYPVHFTADTSDYKQAKAYKDKAAYVWLVDNSIQVLKTFPWYFRPPTGAKESVFRFPYVYDKSRKIKDWDKVQLVSTDITTVKISKQRHVCGIYDPYNGKTRFDMFYLQEKVNLARYEDAKARFPDIEIVKSITEAIEKSSTDMFWFIPDDVILDEKFDFDFEPDDWSYSYCHMFQNGNKKNYNGVALIPTSYKPTHREITYRHFASKKTINIPASAPEVYDSYHTNSYEEFLEIQQCTETAMFWVIRPDVTLNESFKFDYKVPKWDEHYIHVFLNGSAHDGVALFPAACQVSRKEFENRYYIDQKEIEIVASTPKLYDRYTINTFNEYLEALETSTTELFWVIPSDIVIKYEFKFDILFTHDNEYDRKMNHVFLNGEKYNGIMLMSKHKPISYKEFTNRFPTERKEWDIVASRPKLYDKYTINT